jgi:Glycosyltransferase family 87
MKCQEKIVLLIALLAAAAKLYCATTTSGTLDVVCFREFGRIISEEGLIALYQKIPIFNHTPLVGTFSSLIFDATGGRDVPFRLLVRLPGIVADVLTVFALLWLRRKTGQPAWWALGLFAASPVAFMISGYHGNIDSLVALGLVLTALTCFSNQAALCGLCWGLTCQVKIIPLLVAPVFFFFWWSRGQAWRFFTVGVITMLVGWAWPLLTIPQVFAHRVLDYNSMWGTWGISALVRLSGTTELDGVRLAPPGTGVSEVMKLVVAIGVCALAWRRRAGDPQSLFTTLSLSWLLFFVFAPGFCVNYLIWLTPFVLMHSARWYAAITAASSVALFAFYTTVCGSLPWDKAYEGIKTAPQWIPWMLLPWVTMATGMWALRHDWEPNSPAREPGQDGELDLAMKARAS